MPTANSLIHDLLIRPYHLIYHLQGEVNPFDSLESGVFEEFLVEVAVGRACAAHNHRMYIPQV